MTWANGFWSIVKKTTMAVTAATLVVCGAHAQSEHQFIPDKELVIATKEAPPFVIKRADGTLYGISIDLWRQIADQLHLRYTPFTS
jgi:polar amino acid transport system substrate-binding protein